MDALNHIVWRFRFWNLPNIGVSWQKLIDTWHRCPIFQCLRYHPVVLSKSPDNKYEPILFNFALNNLVESLFSWTVNPYADIHLLQPSTSTRLCSGFSECKEGTVISILGLIKKTLRRLNLQSGNCDFAVVVRILFQYWDGGKIFLHGRQSCEHVTDLQWGPPSRCESLYWCSKFLLDSMHPP